MSQPCSTQPHFQFRSILAVIVVLVFASTLWSSEPKAPATVEGHEPPPLVLGKNTVVKKNIAYTEEPNPRTLDVYSPGDVKGAPVVLFIHGGGWTRGDKSEVGAQPRLFNEAGMVLVSIDYRLSPAFRHPAHVDDVAAAIAWAKKNISSFGGDGEKLVVMGHSAGSHLAALVVTDPHPLAKQKLKLSDVRAAISLDGSAFDIVDRIAQGSEKLAENCRRAFGDSQESQLNASPLHHVKNGAGIPAFLLIYVKPDSLNHAQSKTFADKITANGGRAKLLQMAGKDHFSLHADLGTERDTAGKEILLFITEATK